MKLARILKQLSVILIILCTTLLANAQFYAVRDADSLELLKIRNNSLKVEDSLYKSLEGINVQIAAWMIADTNFYSNYFQSN